MDFLAQQLLLCRKQPDGAHWILQLGKSGSTTEGRGIALDEADNAFYVTGDNWVVKCTLSGDVVWQTGVTAVSGVSGVGSISFRSIRTDLSGNVYAAGIATVASHERPGKLFVAKYTSSGNLQWQKLLAGTGEGSPGIEQYYGMQLDSSGRPVVLCSTIASSIYGPLNPIRRIGYIKLDTSGSITAETNYYIDSFIPASGSFVLGSGDTAHFAYTMNRNTFYDGYYKNYGQGTTADEDIEIAIFNNSGIIERRTVFTIRGYNFGRNGDFNRSSDRCGSIAISPDKNTIYIGCGAANILNGYYQVPFYFYSPVYSCDTSGNINGQFTAYCGTYNEPIIYNNPNVFPGNEYNTLMVDPVLSGDLYGTIITPSGGNIITKWTSGAIQWSRTITGVNTGAKNVTFDIAVGTGNAIYIIGKTNVSTIGTQDAFIAKIPKDGTKVGNYGNFNFISLGPFQGGYNAFFTYAGPKGVSETEIFNYTTGVISGSGVITTYTGTRTPL